MSALPTLLTARCPQLALLLTAFAAGCRSAPSTFVYTAEPTWAAIELRDDVDVDHAWTTVTDILARRFDLEMVSKESGYLRTNWLYTWTGKLRPDYAVRCIVKFPPGGRRCDLKSEAQYGSPGSWNYGTDTGLLQTLKTDIMGAIGRTTR